MRKIFIFIALCTGIYVNSQSADKEKLLYKVYFNSFITGNLTAGEAIMEIKPNFDSQNVTQLSVKGATSGFIELFYKVEDEFESYIDPKTSNPVKFVRRIRENKYTHDETVNFNHASLIAETLSEKNGTTRNSRTKISSNTQDILSLIHYTRMYNFTALKNGESIQVPFLIDDSVYMSKIIYSGKERIKVSSGEYNCIKIKPMVATGKVFSNQYAVTLWISDDKNRIPILAESKLSVGKARVELISRELSPQMLTKN